jgi:hypothetical protein
MNPEKGAANGPQYPSPDQLAVGSAVTPSGAAANAASALRDASAAHKGHAGLDLRLSS